MDIEDMWRKAVEEEEASHQEEHGQPRAGAAGENVNAAPAAADSGSCDEFSDDELLQSIPFAHDAAPVMLVTPLVAPAGFPAVTAPMQAGPPPMRAPPKNISSPTSGPELPTVPTRRARAMVASARGVLDFPPAKGSSFMLRGDDGRVRWVTAAAAKGSTSTAAHKQRRYGKPRKRARAEATTAVIEVRDDDGDDGESEDAVVEVDSASSSCASSVVAGGGRGSDADDDLFDGGVDDDSSSFDSGAPPPPPRRPAASHFLRDGVNVQEMLRELYAEEAKKQAQLKLKEVGEEGDGDHQLHDESTPTNLLAPTRTAAPRAPLLNNSSQARRLPSGSGELWVTKYSPKQFRELLSDESINLRLLQWLKSWDAYVFPEGEPSSGGGAASSRPKGGGTTSFPLRKDAPSMKESLAALTLTASTPSAAAAPPEDRIAVLTGPPGVGKTTLVHVLAAHCGYEVIEVNASVERTASRLEALIKTAVSAAGPAPGGRLRRPPPASTAVSTHAEEKDAGDGTAATSLVQHLLRPKCLIIDEMDGIASSSVAAYLVQQQLHRPVFCLCNDFYVPSLRPLRQRCSHVYYLPPIRPQRLLARLEEIACRERMTSLDQMTLSELIITSGGDVRSCLNTIQFVSSVIHQQPQRREGGGDAVPQRHTIADLMRRMQGKDTRLALKESWQMIFTRPERNKGIQLLKQECGVDYEGLIEAAAAQHYRQHVVEARHRREREQSIGRPSFTSAAEHDRHAGGAGKCDGRERKPNGGSRQREVAPGFRVDPGYLLAAQQLTRCTDTAGLVDGLQENYLHRAYTDYSFARTCATAASFSQQDVVVAASFQHPEMMMGTAERLNHVAALTCFVHCSTAARGGRIGFPREQATLRRLQSESQHIDQQFRDGCRPHIAAFLGGWEVTSTDIAPMLLRCLVDRSLRLPAHAITSFRRLPPADQRLLNASVARHVEYGLSYEPDRRYTPPFHGGAAAENSFAPFQRGSGEDEAPWRLTPELDRLLAGIVRPMVKALPGGHGGYGGGGGGRGASFFQRPRYGDRDNGPHAGTQHPSKDSKSSGAAAAPSWRPPLSSVLLPLTNEVRQILVGLIRQHRILQSLELLKRQQQAHRDTATGADAAGTKSNEAGEGADATHDKRPRGDGDIGDGGSLDAAGPQGATDNSVMGIKEAGTTVKAEDDGVPELKKVKQEGVKEVSATPRTAIRRDFFGRPITDQPTSSNRVGCSSNPTTTAASVSSPTGGGGSGDAPRLNPHHVPSTPVCVRYVYQDGSTNAVKMPAVWADF
ncbi:hypothetical protein ABL78_4531 [Leptomonas seymouri]|uniref:AAA+ ATPase domain-containing protein n=1 Tax=Leptomonas seymouri TaxID=5684 RepID=A0A0N1I4S1_LEPSE|nr:hypothetical protein ABL78_4531 [Leptomonas seymouri]|eukprot:KPI86415.1 hypothetical protein ABL78_4531 [Leptomonas seymouri]